MELQLLGMQYMMFLIFYRVHSYDKKMLLQLSPVLWSSIWKCTLSNTRARDVGSCSCRYILLTVEGMQYVLL